MGFQKNNKFKTRRYFLNISFPKIPLTSYHKYYSMMIYVSTIFGVLFTFLSCSPNSNTTQNKIEQPNNKTNKELKLKVGAENIPAITQLLNHKTFAFAGNQTSQINGVHLVDSLSALNCKPAIVFSPEHGFRGKKDAGEKVNNAIDSKTGIPIISLYGNHKKPTPEDLKGLDYIVFDIQDVGVRFYTYISTLHYIMEACAENNVKLIVLDRPNPNSHLIDGPILEPEHQSFVGMHPIPIAHGMTIGEYALMINGEHWLSEHAQCQLKVIPCENYTHQMEYELPIKPSPNLPNKQSILLYPSLCLFEGTTVSVGRGTPLPFQIYGSPELDGPYQFKPQSGPGSKYPKHENTWCYGENLRDYPPQNSLNLSWLIQAYKSSNQPFFSPFFTKLSGTKKLQEQIEKGWSEKDIKNTWADGLKQFKKTRSSYLLYP